MGDYVLECFVVLESELISSTLSLGISCGLANASESTKGITDMEPIF